MGPFVGSWKSRSGSRLPNFVARNISDRRPVFVNQSPKTASAAELTINTTGLPKGDIKVLTFSVHVRAIPEGHATVSSMCESLHGSLIICLAVESSNTYGNKMLCE